MFLWKKFCLSIRAGRRQVESLLKLHGGTKKKIDLRFCLTKIDDWNGELFLINRSTVLSNVLWCAVCIKLFFGRGRKSYWILHAPARAGKSKVSKCVKCHASETKSLWLYQVLFGTNLWFKRWNTLFLWRDSLIKLFYVSQFLLFCKEKFCLSARHRQVESLNLFRLLKRNSSKNKLYLLFYSTEIDDWNGELVLINRNIVLSNFLWCAVCIKFIFFQWKVLPLVLLSLEASRWCKNIFDSIWRNHLN